MKRTPVRASIRSVAATSPRALRALACDACGVAVQQSHGRGLYVRSRGDEIEREEPPLCERCALSIGMTFLVRLAAEEDDG
jgi:hypothetical protein